MVFLWLIFFLTNLSSTISSIFPYTTLFRSLPALGLNRTLVGLARRQFARQAFQAFRLGLGRRLGRGSRIRRRQFARDRKSTRLNSSHQISSYAVFCLKKKQPLSARSPRQ